MCTQSPGETVEAVTWFQRERVQQGTAWMCIQYKERLSRQSRGSSVNECNSEEPCKWSTNYGESFRGSQNCLS